MPALAEIRGTIDVGILAVHAEELAAIAELLPERAGTAHGAREYDLRRVGRRTVALVRGSMGDRPDPARAAAALIEELRPAWLIVVGVASGAPVDEPSLGDVLVAASVLDHGAEAVHEDGSHAFAATPMHADAEALAAKLRAGDQPVVGRIQDGRLLLDARTVLPGEDEALIAAVATAYTR